MSSTTSITPPPSFEELKRLLEPANIAYYDLFGALPTRAMHVCRIIGLVEDSNVLENLLVHSNTLRAPHGKEFPIQRVQSAIIWRIQALNILTSQTW